jgi:hypothetical protein
LPNDTKAVLVTQIFILIFLSLSLTAQSIAPENRIDWQNARLETSFTRQSDHLLVATEAPFNAIANDDQHDDDAMQRLIQKARSCSGLVSLIVGLFMAGIFNVDAIEMY